MIVLIVRYRIKTNRGDGVNAGNFIEVNWDTDTLSFVVYKYNDATLTSPTTLTSGPSLGADRIDYEPVTAVRHIPYSFCDSLGGALNTFTQSATFPYSNKVSTPNHVACSIGSVCSMRFDQSATVIVKPSTAFVGDGSISVQAIDSDGTIEYFIGSVLPGSGNPTGLFTDLFPGEYTITARDSIGCLTEINIILVAELNYGVRYRMEFKSLLNNFFHRLDIEERDYEGELEYVNGSEDPVVLRYNGDGDLDKFTPIVPSEMRVGLLCEENFKFRHLFTQDERKFKVKYYVDIGDGLELKWQGYVLSSNYKEAYIAAPYVISITATDGLADLKQYDFDDSNGNLFNDEIILIDAIAAILEKCGLQNNIISAINKYELSMDTDIDPLLQAKIDPNTFYFREVSKCDYALSEILKPFGAKILMRNGDFFIHLVEQSVDEMPYRQFNTLGEYVSQGVIDDRDFINFSKVESGVIFNGRNETLEIIPAYGSFVFQHDLLAKPSLIESYSFEEEDTYVGDDGVTLIKGWTVNVNDAPGATFGIKETQAFDGRYNFFYHTFYLRSGNIILPINLSTINDVNFQMLTLTSATKKIEYDNEDSIEFRFSYAVLLKKIFRGDTLPRWIKLSFKISIGDYYYDAGLGWIEDEYYNEIYVTSFNSNTEYKIVTPLPNVETLTLDDFNVEFRFYTDKSLDFVNDNYDNFNLLKAIPTVNEPNGKRVKGKVTKNPSGPNTVGPFYCYFVLRDEEYSKPESLPSFIRPSDYHSSTNARVWVNESNVFDSVLAGDIQGDTPRENIVDYWYFDNVILRHLPKGAEPPSNVAIEIETDRNIKLSLTRNFRLNDIDTDNINNSEYTYYNYFKKLDGTNTVEWFRSYRPDNGRLMQLVSNEIVSQYRRPLQKLTGIFSFYNYINPSAVLKEVNDNGRNYIFAGYEMHARDSSINFDLLEIVDTFTDEESPDFDAGFSLGFSLGFRS